MNIEEKAIEPKGDVKKFTGLTPTTRRIIVGSLGLIGVAVVLGAAFGKIATGDAMLIIVSINTGFFTLLKGGV